MTWNERTWGGGSNPWEADQINLLIRKFIFKNIQKIQKIDPQYITKTENIGHKEKVP